MAEHMISDPDVEQALQVLVGSTLTTAVVADFGATANVQLTFDRKGLNWLTVWTDGRVQLGGIGPV